MQQCPEQQKRDMIVSQIDKNMFVEAGAGAGKTTLIKKRIVNQLKTGVQPGEIVAITFTNAATRQLKSRIIEELEQELDKLVVQAPDSTETLNLKKAQETIDQMQISTIHSFCFRILQERSLDAGMSMDITLLEDAEFLRLREESFQVWAKTLKKSDWEVLLGAGDYPKRALELLQELTNQLIGIDPAIKVEYVTSNMNRTSLENRVDPLFQALESIIIRPFVLAYGKNSQNKAINGLADLDKAWLVKDGEELQRLFVKGDKLQILAFLVEPHSTGYCFVSKISKTNVKKCLSQLKKQGSIIDEEPFTQQITAALEAIPVWMDTHKADLTRILQEYKHYAYSRYVDYALQARSHFFRWLGPDRLTKDLLIQRTREMLDTSEEARLYFGEKFKCIYVDEFQDTDHIQESFIRRLAENPKNPGHLRTGALFIVGDPKQSIYRFRGAEPEVYFQTKDFFEQEEASGNAYVFELRDNYRSDKEIVDWVNTQFKGKDITPGRRYVEMTPVKCFPSRGSKTLHGVYYQTSLTTSVPQKDMMQDVESVAALIQYLVGNKYRIVKEKNGIEGEYDIEYSDFMILCRNTTHMTLYADYFRQVGIPLSMDAKIEISEQWYMQVFYRIYAYLASPFDSIGRVSAREGMLAFGVTREAADEVLNSLREQTKEMTPVALLEFLCKNWSIFLTTGMPYDSSLLDEIRGRIIKMVMSVISTASGSKRSILNAISDYLGQKIEHELSLDSNPNTVTFMNLHKAKGLEGNIVIWANRQEKTDFKEDGFLDEGSFYPNISKDYQTYWCGYRGDESIVQKAKDCDEAENIRLEYVAATRAKQVLIFMDRYLLPRRSPESAFMFQEGFDCGNQSIQSYIDLYHSTHASANNLSVMSTEQFAIVSTDQANEQSRKQVYLDVSPSKEENESAGKKSADKGRKDDLRPVGNIFGNVMHRTFELAVGRWQLDFASFQQDELMQCCKQAIYENLADIPTDQTKRYEEFLTKILIAYQTWWQSQGLHDKVTEFYTELPFSYFYEDENGDRVWSHGFADLVLKVKTGETFPEEYWILDYKSDTDAAYEDEQAFIQRLNGKYGDQLRAYRHAVQRAFEVADDMPIRTMLISFSNKDVTDSSGVRLRVTEVQ